MTRTSRTLTAQLAHALGVGGATRATLTLTANDVPTLEVEMPFIGSTAKGLGCDPAQAAEQILRLRFKLVPFTSDDEPATR